MKPTRPAASASRRLLTWALCAAGALLVGAVCAVVALLGWGRGSEPGSPLEHQRALALLDAYVPEAREPARPAPRAMVAPDEAAAVSPADQVSLGAALYRRGLARFQSGDHAAAEEDLAAAVTCFARSAEPAHLDAALGALRQVLLLRPGLPESLCGRDLPDPDWGLETSLRYRVCR